MYAVVLLPLLSMGYKSALIPEIQIPNFITGELFKTTMGQVGYYTFFAVVAYLNLRWIFVLPIIVLEEAVPYGSTQKRKLSKRKLL